MGEEYQELEQFAQWIFAQPVEDRRVYAQALRALVADIEGSLAEAEPSSTRKQTPTKRDSRRSPTPAQWMSAADTEGSDVNTTKPIASTQPRVDSKQSTRVHSATRRSSSPAVLEISHGDKVIRRRALSDGAFRADEVTTSRGRPNADSTQYRRRSGDDPPLNLQPVVDLHSSESRRRRRSARIHKQQERQARSNRVSMIEPAEMRPTLHIDTAPPSQRRHTVQGPISSTVWFAQEHAEDAVNEAVPVVKEAPLIMRKRTIISRVGSAFMRKIRGRKV
jgi:hypothetical protein